MPSSTAGRISIYYHFTSLKVLHTNISGWFSIRDCVTASFLESPGLFIAFWPISITLVWMVLTRLLISMSTNPFSDCTERANNNWYHRHFHASFFSFIWQGLGIYLSFLFPSVLPCGQPERVSLPLLLTLLFQTRQQSKFLYQLINRITCVR